MNRIRVHYNPDTGRIIAWDNSLVGEALMGGRIVIFEVPEGHDLKIDPTAHRVNLETLDLEDMSDAEIAAARAPQEWEVKQVVWQDLADTESLAATTDRYVPDRDAWKAYRQALRDVSKPQLPEPDAPRPSPIEMLNAFPVRPDGRDAAALLRARIPQG